MSKVLDFKRRNSKVRAMRIIIGETTRAQILAFAPEANVGVTMKSGVPDDLDIRWVVVSNGLNREPAEMTSNGQWLVETPEGIVETFDFMDDDEFHRMYESGE